MNGITTTYRSISSKFCMKIGYKSILMGKFYLNELLETKEL